MQVDPDIAEVHVSGPGALLTRHALREVPEAKITVRYQATDAHEGLIVEHCSFEAFETALAADPDVADFERIASFPEARVYNVAVAPDTRLLSTELAALGIQVLDVVSRPGESDWLLRLRCPDRATLREFRAYCEETGVTLRIEKVYRESTDLAGSGTTDDEDASWTAKQRETVEMAVERGYFEVPRRTSLAELSEELGVSEQAVSERLRRGLGAVLAPRTGEEQ